MAKLTMIKKIYYELLLTPDELKVVHKSLWHVYIQPPDHLRGFDFVSVLNAIKNCKKGE